jgi:hypothetical protein
MIEGAGELGEFVSAVALQAGVPISVRELAGEFHAVVDIPFNRARQGKDHHKAK